MPLILENILAIPSSDLKNKPYCSLTFARNVMNVLPTERKGRRADEKLYQVDQFNPRDFAEILTCVCSLEDKTPKEEEEPLSRIIEEMNDRYGTEFNEADKVILLRLKNSLENNEDLRTSAKINSEENFRLSFRHMFDELLLTFISDHFAFYKKINDNKNLKKDLVDNIFTMVYKILKEGGKD